MKLNTKKCAFGVRAGKFSGFMVSKRGIGANLEKIWVILDMPSSKIIKDIQHLTGRVISAYPSLKLEELLFVTEEYQATFKKRKLYLTSLPLLMSPRMRETLYLYLATLEETVVAVLNRTEGIRQFPVYYISKELQNSEKSGNSQVVTLLPSLSRDCHDRSAHQ
ncbi:RVT_1 domain-containing protein [Gossypium australe]|uniref:RVT_1 domain-containing protein n=1 Tax=Gossypium australe TaxID=47621 RepID=A0A5B6X2P5_9ROSI|nr:RVT_1 domain-containing protein [Gossypium australe]